MAIKDYGIIKMTKEKPLIEKIRELDMQIMNDEISLLVFLNKRNELDALAVKRLKKELDDEHVNYWIDEIFGEFK